MLAGVAAVRAAAQRFEVTGAGEQGDAAVRERVRHLLVEEGGDVAGAFHGGIQEAVPVGVGEGAEADLGAVGAGAAAADVGQDLAGGDGDGVDVALGGVGAAAGEAGGVEGSRLQGGEPGVAPPGGGERLACGSAGSGGEGGERSPEVAVSGGGGHGAGGAGGWCAGGCGRGRGARCVRGCGCVGAGRAVPRAPGSGRG